MASHLLTAEQYLRRTAPAVLELMLNCQEALAFDTDTAREVAKQLGVSVDGNAFPVAVWQLVYRM